MAANVKSMENQTKHLTNREKDARTTAEAEMLPARKAKLKVPKSLSGDDAARGYWRSILRRMDGLAILDDLDAEILAAYCETLSRKDALSFLCRELMEKAKLEPDVEMQFELISSIDSVLARLQAHEKSILSYADKLGLTPESRVRLARKRAAQEAEAVKDDLFGD